jgi:hypothetical protein
VFVTICIVNQKKKKKKKRRRHNPNRKELRMNRTRIEKKETKCETLKFLDIIKRSKYKRSKKKDRKEWKKNTKRIEKGRKSIAHCIATKQREEMKICKMLLSGLSHLDYNMRYQKEEMK